MYDKTDDGQSGRILVLSIPRWRCRVDLKTRFALSVVNAGVEELYLGKKYSENLLNLPMVQL
jgi:hypothetical protein